MKLKLYNLNHDFAAPAAEDKPIFLPFGTWAYNEKIDQTFDADHAAANHAGRREANDGERTRGGEDERAEGRRSLRHRFGAEPCVRRIRSGAERDPREVSEARTKGSGR